LTKKRTTLDFRKAWTEFLDNFGPYGHIHTAAGWTSLLDDRKEDAKALSQALADRVPTANLWNRIWPQQLVQYGHYDALTDTRIEMAALVLGSKKLVTWAVEQLSETADMALTELANSGGKGLQELKADLVTTNLKPGNFSSLLWFKVIVILVAINTPTIIALACLGALRLLLPKLLCLFAAGLGRHLPLLSVPPTRFVLFPDSELGAGPVIQVIQPIIGAWIQGVMMS
jgi:hypothetical protein